MSKKLLVVSIVLVLLASAAAAFAQENVLYVMDDFRVVGGGGLDESRIPVELRVLGDWCGTSYDVNGSGSYGWLCKYANPSSFRVTFKPQYLNGASVAKACIRWTTQSTQCMAGTAGSAVSVNNTSYSPTFGYDSSYSPWWAMGY